MKNQVILKTIYDFRRGQKSTKIYKKQVAGGKKENRLRMYIQRKGVFSQKTTGTSFIYIYK